MNETTLKSSTIVLMDNKIHNDFSGNMVVITKRISDNKRKGLMKPIISSNKIIDVSCMICNTDKLNASAVCYLCNRVICSYHTFSVNQHKFCTICKESKNSGPILHATFEHYNKKRKWKFCCFF